MSDQLLTLSDLTQALTTLRTDIHKDTAAEIASLKSIIATQQAEIVELKTRLTDYELRLLNIENKPITAMPTNMNGNVIAQPPIDFKAILAEERDRESRVNNLILFNIPETSNDILKIKEILNKIELTENIEFNEVKRFGKANNNRPRPVKVVTKLAKDKFTILKHSKKLRELPNEDNCRNIYIKPDLTKIQLEEGKRLYTELKHRRDVLKEKVMIKRGVIVQKD